LGSPPLGSLRYEPTKREHAVVDVFTDRLTLGNPLAVVIDSDGLSAEDPVTGSLNASMAL